MKALLFLLLVGLAPEDVTRDFEAASERALAGDAEQAIALYTSIIERGYDDADVYYNLGYVLEDAERPIEAIVAYERALSRNPQDEDAEANLARLRAKAASRAPKEDPSVASVSEILAPLIRTVPIATVGWAGGLFSLLGFSLLSLFPRSPGARKASALALALGFFLYGLVGLRALVEGERRAVAVEEAPLLEGPDPRFSTRGKLVPGERLRILRKEAGFREVQRVDGSTGFVDRDALEVVSPHTKPASPRSG